MAELLGISVDPAGLVEVRLFFSWRHFVLPFPTKQVVSTRDKGALRCTYRATVRVTRKDGSFREGVGFGNAQGVDEHATRCEAIDAALRAAEARAHDMFENGAPRAASAAGGPPSLNRRQTTALAELKGASPATSIASSSTAVVSAPAPAAAAAVAAPVAAQDDEEGDEEADEERTRREEQEKLAQAEARRLELRRQKQEEEEIERKRIEQEEEEERQRAEKEEEEERQREEEAAKTAAEEKKRAEEEKKKAEEEAQKREAEEAKKRAAAERPPAAAAPEPAGGRKGPAGTVPVSPDLTRLKPTSAAPAPAPAARPKALSVKTAAPPPAAAAPPPVVSPMIPRAASVPNAGRGPVRAGPGGAVAPAPQAAARGGAPTSPAAVADGQRRQLSLSSRKNVKQSQPLFAEHAGRLQDALGLDIQIQSKVDWVALADVCDEKGHKNMCGEIFYGQVMEGLVGNLSRLSNKGREALIEQWSSGAISLRFDAAQKSQWSASVIGDGELELVSKGEPWLDTDNVGADLVDLLDGGSDVGVAKPATGGVGPLQANVAQFSGAFAEHAAAIKKAVGLEVAPTHNVNFEELNGHLKTLGKENQAGAVFQDSIMRELAGNISRLCQKNMVVKAVRKLWSTGTISLAYNEQQKEPWNAQLLKGTCVITAKPSALLSGHETIGRSIVDKVTDDDTGLPIMSAQDMYDNDAAIRGNLERIRTAVGLQYDIVPDIDFFELCSHVNSVPGFDSKVGSVWAAVLERLADQLESVAVQPDALDILLTIWGNAVLKLAFDDTLDEGVWQCDFVDGDLILYSHPRGCVLPEGVGEDLADRVFGQ